MAILELNNVSKAFGDGDERAQVLSDINLKMADGEFVAILGFSGTGKSTLMNILFGLLQPDSGTIEVDGKIVKINSPKEALEPRAPLRGRSPCTASPPRPP